MPTNHPYGSLRQPFIVHTQVSCMALDLYTNHTCPHPCLCMYATNHQFPYACLLGFCANLTFTTCTSLNFCTNHPLPSALAWFLHKQPCQPVILSTFCTNHPFHHACLLISAPTIHAHKPSLWVSAPTIHCPYTGLLHGS